METTNHLHDTNTAEKRNSILYPIMLIAAIAVIIFSVIGIATMTGVLPSALSKHEQTAPESAAKGPSAAVPSPQPAKARVAAYAGHEIEKNMNKSLSYQIRVRMNDGTSRTFYERSQPGLSVGQKVRVTNNGVVAAG